MEENTYVVDETIEETTDLIATDDSGFDGEEKDLSLVIGAAIGAVGTLLAVKGLKLAKKKWAEHKAKKEPSEEELDDEEVIDVEVVIEEDVDDEKAEENHEKTEEK